MPEAVVSVPEAVSSLLGDVDGDELIEGDDGTSCGVEDGDDGDDSDVGDEGECSC